jgi:hypothetical protein
VGPEDGLFDSGLLFGFCILRVNPGFVSCYDTQEEVSVISDSSSSRQTDNKPLFLLVGELLRHKLHGDPQHVPSPLLEFTGMFHTRGLTCQCDF